MSAISNKEQAPFTSLGLSKPILDAIEEQGYSTPTPIQAGAIPKILQERDLMGAAQTGTGKTAGFTLPILELLARGPKPAAKQVRTLILTPTRELAAQVNDSVALYGKYLPLKSAVVFGGVNIKPQIKKLSTGVDILVATPGRLLDLYGQNAVKFNSLEILVLDEADRMLDMGFIHDIKRIIKIIPKKRQNLLFSATFSASIRELASKIVNNPLEVSVSPPNAAAKSVNQWMCPVDKSKKSSLLIHLIEKNNWEQVLVFTKTKHGANRVTKHLEKNEIKAAAIHGNKSQGARTRALAEFKSGDVKVLVATDIAARGIDIDALPQVINYDLPNVPESYVHRIGRTGRAGSEGEAVSFVSEDEIKELKGIERLIKSRIPRVDIEGFKTNEDIGRSAAKPAGRSNSRRGSRDNSNNRGRSGNNSTTQAPRRRKRRASSE